MAGFIQRGGNLSVDALHICKELAVIYIRVNSVPAKAGRSQTKGLRTCKKNTPYVSEYLGVTSWYIYNPLLSLASCRLRDLEDPRLKLIWIDKTPLE
jgi:hypothetical protein